MSINFDLSLDIQSITCSIGAELFKVRLHRLEPDQFATIRRVLTAISGSKPAE